MGAQSQTDSGILEIRFNNNYLFQVRVISEKEVGLEVIDIKTFQMFQIQSHVFQSQVNSSTLIAALNQKEHNFLNLLVVPSQNQEKEPILKITIKVTFDFIPHFEECIILSLNKQVQENERIQAQMKLINNEVKELQNQLLNYKSSKQLKKVVAVKSGNFNSANHTICKIELPEGKYELNLSFYTKSTQNWIYLKLSNLQSAQDILKLPEGGYYFTQTNSGAYQPHIIRAIVDVKGDKQTFSLDSQACNSYPWNMKNLVLSATSI